MEYKDEMSAKWEQYKALQESGEDTRFVVEEMLDLTDELNSDPSYNRHTNG